ncbi:MAG: prephenate dehydratase [Fimbriimonadaceae bacterium]|nr:prephenate dehydratase [Fimbriimonadaceae bacterium]
MAAGRRVEDVRGEIDSIDSEIVQCLVRRAELAREIGSLKGKSSEPYFTPEREHEIFQRLRSLPSGPLRSEQIVAVFREVISAARAAERPLTVSYWGPQGTYSYLALVQVFGRSTTAAPADSIADVFLAVENGQADYGIVPIENSVAGVVLETLDSFPVTNVKICDETFVPVSHVLAGSVAGLEGVERVYAGPQPAQQCRAWLRANLPNAEIVPVAPTVKAAQMALDDPAGAAIVNSMTVEMLGMTEIARRIEDNPHNRTRFVVLGFNEPRPTGRDKTTLLFNLRNEPGALYKVLGAFFENGVNLTMIESRPAPRASFEYLFFADCGGHRSDDRVARAIQQISAIALESTVLGSYPSNDPSLQNP